MRKLLPAVCLLLITTGASAGIRDVEYSLFTLAREYYTGMETLYRKAEHDSISVEDIDTVIRPVKDQAAKISHSVIRKMKSSDLTEYKELVRLYNLHVQSAPELRDPFNLVVDDIVEYQKSRSLNSREYFPGYGCSEDGPFGYRYRRTRQLSSKVLSVYWKKISETIEKGTTRRMTLDSSMVAKLAGQAVLEAIGKPFEINVDGETKPVCEYNVTFQKNVAMESSQKFQKVKVWFRLQRARKFLWIFWGNWNDCGRTYDISEEESDNPVTE
ncbi:MAG: hypothetical protein PHQ23_03290 [Candidatus Wallbacteria bacterium]|nr:hypothetical protein [Candidatus Wallbacteria bacterium]